MVKNKLTSNLTDSAHKLK